MSWTVALSNKAAKQAQKMPPKIQKALRALIGDIVLSGPVRGNWPNYGKIIKDGSHHCHLDYRHACCWRVDPGTNQVEIYYVGTRENVPY